MGGTPTKSGIVIFQYMARSVKRNGPSGLAELVRCVNNEKYYDGIFFLDEGL
jgi:hypothetical protein